MSYVIALPPRVRLKPHQWLIARVAGTAGFQVAAAKNPDRWVSHLAIQTVRHAPRPSTHAEAAHAVSAVTTAHLRLGGTTACLPRCLAALLYCRAHGHTPAFIIGVRPGTAQVHAWLEVDGQPAGEPSDPRRAYIPVSIYLPGKST